MINNDGSITIHPGGVVNDTGTVNGNPIPEPGAGLGALAVLLTLSWLCRRRFAREGRRALP